MAEKKPKPLKVYLIGNFDGRNARIVAATSKPEAAKAMQCRPGYMASEGVILSGEDAGRPIYSEGYRLAMATPGIAWVRESTYGVLKAAPWRCLDPVAGAKAIVLARFPAARCVADGLWAGPEVWVGDYDRPIGSGDTEDAAWLDAARAISVEPPPGLPDNAITVWRSEDAPESFRGLGTGSDEDWIAFVPAALAGEYIAWLESRSPFGVYRVSRHPIKGGEVRIGAHA